MLALRFRVRQRVTSYPSAERRPEHRRSQLFITVIQAADNEAVAHLSVDLGLLSFGFGTELGISNLLTAPQKDSWRRSLLHALSCASIA
jgi:hypothetical protein